MLCSFFLSVGSSAFRFASNWKQIDLWLCCAALRLPAKKWEFLRFLGQEADAHLLKLKLTFSWKLFLAFFLLHTNFLHIALSLSRTSTFRSTISVSYRFCVNNNTFFAFFLSFFLCFFSQKVLFWNSSFKNCFFFIFFNQNTSTKPTSFSKSAATTVAIFSTRNFFVLLYFKSRQNHNFLSKF